jgi:hypothetical protein
VDDAHRREDARVRPRAAYADQPRGTQGARIGGGVPDVEQRDAPAGREHARGFAHGGVAWLCGAAGRDVGAMVPAGRAMPLPVTCIMRRTGDSSPRMPFGIGAGRSIVQTGRPTSERGKA